MFIFNAFTQEDIIKHANSELASAGSKTQIKSIKALEGSIVTAITERGGLLALILCSLSTHSVLAFRGIHKVVNKSNRWTYLINGQAGKNLSTILFNGENGQRYYANAIQTTKYFSDLLQMSDESIRLEKVNERVSWEAEANPVIQNDIIAAIKALDVKVTKNFDYSPVKAGENAVFFTLCDRLGSVVTQSVGQLNLMKLTAINPKQGFFLTKVSVGASEHEIQVAKAKCIWDRLGDTPVTEDDTIDEAFLHFYVGTDVSDIWHWVENNFDICIGEDILNAMAEKMAMQS